MSNNAGNTSVQSVTPVVNKESKEKLEQVTVTVIADKETATIITSETAKYLDLALQLQDDKESPEAFKKMAVEDAVKNYLKASCTTTVAKWQNFVRKVADTPKYRSTHNMAQVEAILKDNAKFKWLYNAAVSAAIIKKNL